MITYQSSKSQQKCSMSGSIDISGRVGYPISCFGHLVVNSRLTRLGTAEPGRYYSDEGPSIVFKVLVYVLKPEKRQGKGGSRLKRLRELTKNVPFNPLVISGPPESPWHASLPPVSCPAHIMSSKMDT